jgi:hypothetical protein
MTPAYDKYIRAMQGVESTNNYGAIGPRHPKYGRALGISQVMESNLPEWTQAAVGRQVGADEFLATPEIQDAVTRHRFGELVKKHGSVQDALSAWHSGRPLSQAQNAKDSLGTQTPDYVNKIMAAAEGTPGGTQADMPAPGAVETGGPTPAAPAGFMEGGPGALFGMPQKDWSLGDGLMGAGAALMARDNPTGASALAAMAVKAKNTQSALGRTVVKTDPKTGMVTRYDPTTDTFKTDQVFPRTNEPDDPTDQNRKMFQQNHEKANAHAMLSETFDSARRRIAEGDMDFSVLSQVKKSAAELFDQKLSPAQLNAVKFAVDMENARADILRTFPGVQTEGDAKRAMDMLKPGGMGNLSNDAVMAAMEKGFTRSTRLHGEQLKYNESLYSKFGDRIAPSDYGSLNAERQKNFAAAEETYKPLKESYTKKREEVERQKQGGPSAGPAGRPLQAPAPNAPTGGLYDAHKSRTQK